MRTESTTAQGQLRKEIQENMTRVSESVRLHNKDTDERQAESVKTLEQRLARINQATIEQLGNLNTQLETKLKSLTETFTLSGESLRKTVDVKLTQLQEDNGINHESVT